MLDFCADTTSTEKRLPLYRPHCSHAALSACPPTGHTAIWADPPLGRHHYVGCPPTRRHHYVGCPPTGRRGDSAQLTNNEERKLLTRDWFPSLRLRRAHVRHERRVPASMQRAIVLRVSTAVRLGGGALYDVRSAELLEGIRRPRTRPDASSAPSSPASEMRSVLVARRS